MRSPPAGLALAGGRAGERAPRSFPTEKYLAADGIENVIGVLEDIESKRYRGLEFVELNACPGGCVGWCAPGGEPLYSKGQAQPPGKAAAGKPGPLDAEVTAVVNVERTVSYDPAMELGGNAQENYERYIQLQEILAGLPGIDCGSCGAPTCEAFAEEIL